VILSLDGETVIAPGTIFRLLDRSRIDKQCTIELLRDGTAESATIVPKERAEPSEEASGA
jgi:hypothetical protein